MFLQTVPKQQNLKWICVLFVLLSGRKRFSKIRLLLFGQESNLSVHLRLQPLFALNSVTAQPEHQTIAIINVNRTTNSTHF